MVRYTVNASILLTDRPLLERPAAAAEAGFGAVEFWWPWATAVPGDAEVGRGETVGQGALAGVSGFALNPARADRMGGDPFLRGIFITGIQRGSIAHRIGLRPNDVIQSIDGRAVTSVEALGRAARGSELVILRGGRALNGRIP